MYSTLIISSLCMFTEHAYTFMLLQGTLFMKSFKSPAYMLLILLLSSCANNPPLKSESALKAESVRVEQEEQPTEQKRQASVKPQPSSSIIPDINDKGLRGDLARKILAKSSAQFLKADVNHDYKISPEEAGMNLIYISKDFARYDKNKDASVSWQEYLGHDKWPAPVH